MKHFSRSSTEDMKPPLKRDPDGVMIHVGTNDLSQDPETFAKNIIDIVKNSTTKKNQILVSRQPKW